MDTRKSTPAKQSRRSQGATKKPTTRIVRSQADLIAVARERKPAPPTAKDLDAISDAFGDCFNDIVLISQALDVAEDGMANHEALGAIATNALNRLIKRMEPVRWQIDTLASRAAHAEMVAAEA